MRIRYLYLDGVRYTDVKKFETFLDDERKKKIERLRFEKDKLLSLAAGLLVFREVKVAFPLSDEIDFEMKDGGKPYLKGHHDFFFSLSHSGALAAVAVDGDEVGLDVEKKVGEEKLKIASRFFHPDEVNHIENAGNPREAFTEVWTKKEAYLKHSGVGIATDLKSFNVLSSPLSAGFYSLDLGDYILSVYSENKVSFSSLDIREVSFCDLLDSFCQF